MSRLFILFALLGLSACDRPSDSQGQRHILGCYFSEFGEPLHVGRDIIQTENRRHIENYRFERSESSDYFGTIILDGYKVAAFDRESAEFIGWISPVANSGYIVEVPPTTRITISGCGERPCFSIPAVIEEADVQYRQSECNGAFLMP